MSTPRRAGTRTGPRPGTPSGPPPAPSSWSARLARAATALAAWALAGCVVVPVTRDVYDPDCRLMRREVTLEAAVLGQFHSCAGQECAALLATLGVVSAATLVVSGSLAVVGNVVYWLEHEVNCRRNAPPAAPPAAPGPPRAPDRTVDPGAPGGAGAAA